MATTTPPPLETVNRTRWNAAQQGGHYESFFQRANHPTRPLAFWIRYTLISPAGPGAALAELWAVVFDGETGTHVAVKQESPLGSATFDPARFRVEVDGARLGGRALVGAAASNGHRIAWELAYRGDEPPLRLLPPALYDRPFPSAKALTGMPLAVYAGTLVVDGRRLDVEGWVGSQNHNWGTRHTDQYAWGQVAGFDEDPTAFLELATARVRVVGPLWSPFLTMIVLRHRGREIALNHPLRAVRAHGRFEYFVWRFRSEDATTRLDGTISAPPDAFVGLRYANPPGGVKTCLNSKIAACALRVTDKRSGATETLTTRHRAAFEILTDDASHGIALRA